MGPAYAIYHTCDMSVDKSTTSGPVTARNDQGKEYPVPTIKRDLSARTEKVQVMAAQLTKDTARLPQTCDETIVQNEII